MWGYKRRLDPQYVERSQTSSALPRADKTQAQRVFPTSDVILRTFQLVLVSFGLRVFSSYLVFLYNFKMTISVYL